MDLQFEAKLAAVRTAAAGSGYLQFVAGLVLAASLGGCLPAGPPTLGADPADPTVPVPAVGYRSGIVPYTSMRPASPAPRNGQGPAPSSKPDQ